MNMELTFLLRFQFLHNVVPFLANCEARTICAQSLRTSFIKVGLYLSRRCTVVITLAKV